MFSQGFIAKTMCWVPAASAALLSLALFHPASQAAAINYGNFPGAGVNFLQVTESSATDPVPLYGAPHVAPGDILDFDPGSFGSNASGGAADVTDGQLQATVQAKPGFGITKFALSELGSYTLAGLGTPATSAQVGQVAFVKITELNGIALGANAFTVSMNSTFSPSGGDFFLPGEAGVAQQWNGSGSIDVAAALAAKKISDPATYGGFTQVTRVEFSTNNTLVTTSEIGTVAFIDKKDLVLDIDAVLPEPASLALAALAIPALFKRRR